MTCIVQGRCLVFTNLDSTLVLQVDVSDVIDAHSTYLWATRQILDMLELESYYPVFRSTICIQ